MAAAASPQMGRGEREEEGDERSGGDEDDREGEEDEEEEEEVGVRGGEEQVLSLSLQHRCSS